LPASPDGASLQGIQSEEVKGKLTEMREANKAYVYAILADGVDRYYGVSEGRSKRVREQEHIRIINKIARDGIDGVKSQKVVYRRFLNAFKNGAALTTRIVAGGMTAADAYGYEKTLIAETRAKSPSQLWNVSGGGYGYPHDLLEEDRAAIKTMLSINQKKNWDNNPKRKKIISEFQRDAWNDADTYEDMCAAISDALADPAVKALRSEIKTEFWNDPEKRAFTIERMRQIAATEEYRKGQSWRAFMRWANEEFYDREAARLAERNRTFEARVRSSATAKQNWKNPAFKKFMSNMARRLMADEQFRAKLDAARWTEEAREIQAQKNRNRFAIQANRDHLSTLNIERMKDPVVRQNLSDKAHERWDNDEWAGSQRERIREQENDFEFVTARKEGTDAYWDNPDNQKKESERRKALNNDPAYKERHAAGLRNAWANDPDRKARTSAQTKLRWALWRKDNGKPPKPGDAEVLKAAQREATKKTENSVSSAASFAEQFSQVPPYASPRVREQRQRRIGMRQ
jgi:hypothetical protein